VSFITVRQGGVDIPDGVYPVILTEISEPKTVTAQRGPNAGKDIDLLDWTFAIDAGEYEGTEITSSTTTASGPKSKLFSYLTALLEGKAPPVGATFERTDLVGRTALATIRRDDGGWPRIENLGAMPTTMPTPKPTRPAPVTSSQRAAAAAAPATDDLPF
jgi:hypothetical protein